MTGQNGPFYLIAILFAVLIVMFGVITFSDDKNNNDLIQKNVISVSGSAEKKVAPDEGYIYFTLESKENSAKLAESKNNELYNKIKLALEGKDYVKIGLEYYNINPESVWDQNKYLYINTGNYVATHSVRVTTSDVSKTGELISLLTDNGVKKIDNIAFGVSKSMEDKVKDELWAEAMSDAKSRADIIAKAANARLERIPQSISVSDYYSPMPYYANRDFSTVSGEEKDSVSIDAKEQTISVNLSVVYKYE